MCTKWDKITVTLNKSGRVDVENGDRSEESRQKPGSIRVIAGDFEQVHKALFEIAEIEPAFPINAALLEIGWHTVRTLVTIERDWKAAGEIPLLEEDE